MKTHSAAILLALALSLTACTPSAQKPLDSKESPIISTSLADPTLDAAVYRKISVQETKEIMDSGEDYILLDVRTQEEYEQGYIKNAVLIPDNEISTRAEKELTDKNARILIYCRSGRRSALAAQRLVEMGYTNVYDFGGIIDWPYGTVME